MLHAKKRKIRNGIQTHERTNTHEKFNNSKTLDSLLLSFFSRFSLRLCCFQLSLHLLLLTLLARPTIIYEHPTTTTSTESLCCCCCSGRRNTNTFCILCIFCIHIQIHMYMVTLCILCVNVERIYLSVCHFNNLHDVLSSLQISYSYTCLNSTHTHIYRRTHAHTDR